MKTLILAILTVAFLPFAGADEISDAALFHQIFTSEVRAMNPTASASDIQNTHFLPDAAVVNSLKALSLEEAMSAIRSTNLVSLVQTTAQTQSAVNIPEIPADAQPLTLVLVPGVFAEFIKNRAFEEVFERPSALREEFVRLVADKKAVDRVSPLRKYLAGQSADALSEERSLDQVIHMGEIQAGGKTVRVILFFTEFGTLESLGDAKERAALFNERLEKYIELYRDVTGPQKLALIGYSRGTILGLEMLAQAQKAGKPWVNDVKAMISLSGVAMGSSLADSTIYDETSPMRKILADLKATVDSLRPAEGWFSHPAIVLQNNAAWLKFGANAAALMIAMNKDKAGPHSVSPVRSLVQVDPRSPALIVMKMWMELGLDNFKKGYDQNIKRFQYFVSQLTASVTEMTTQARVEWWSTHDLPKNPIYYSLTASMANPDANAEELELYKNPLAYGNGSYDDLSLLQNRLDYEKISKVSLNDSQVSVVQAAFIPGVIRTLNPNNDGIRTKFLGTAGTHHWGLALREVNKMDHGQRNGFPREALLKAFATQVMIDRAN